METTDQGMSEEQAMDALDVSEETEIETDEAPVEEQTEPEEDLVDEDDGEDGDPETDLDDAEEDADEADEDAEDEAPDTYVVKVDGQDVEVTLDDLKRSYSGQEYIRKGMEENAQARKMLEQYFDDLQEQRNSFASYVQSIRDAGVIPKPTPPDPQLANTDPIGYMQERAEFETQLAAYQQQQAASQEQEAYQRQVEAQLQQQQEQQIRQYVESQKAKLIEAIPEFGDPQKAAQLRDEIMQIGADYNFAPEELSRLADARVIIALNDLRQFKRVKQSKRKVAEKVANARPVAKPGSANKSRGRAKKRQDLMSKLRETGSDEYALRLLEE